MSETPQDPFTVISTAATTLHETYLSLIEAGFTRADALYLIGQILRGASQWRGATE